MHMTVAFSMVAATCPGKEFGGVALLVIVVCSPSKLSLFVDLAAQIRYIQKRKIPSNQIR